MNEIIKINTDNSDRPTVMGRELHEALEIKARYTDWFKRMCEYGFTENSDFVLVTQKCETNNPKNPTTEIINHQLSIDMAKEICMIQRSDIGRKCRQYFIEVEKKWNSPEAVMDRALKYADQKIKQLEQERDNFPISSEQVDKLEREMRIKAIDLCGCGRVYDDVGISIVLAIEKSILRTLNAKCLEQIKIRDFEQALKMCKSFKPTHVIRDHIDSSRFLLKFMKGA